MAGHNDGFKDRPCVIVSAAGGTGADTLTVTVAPITHSPPRDADAAIELPANVKRHLGLDELRSWIMLDEFNEFGWPGFDLRPLPSKPGQYAYGFLPPALFTRIIQRVLDLRHAGRGLSFSREAG